ncbi:MAG: hypothetical protein AAAB20_29535, partial [Rhizobium sp.]|uniref:hypothetical protein n=1 Tax=Rhizobium sp. TaxID=391 RepID=UPI0030F22ABF
RRKGIGYGADISLADLVSFGDWRQHIALLAIDNPFPNFNCYHLTACQAWTAVARKGALDGETLE